MSSCSVCFGNGTLFTGRFAPCRRCGGSGDSQCSACYGSGASTKELFEKCWACQGTGNIRNANIDIQSEAQRRPTKARSRSSARAYTVPAGTETSVVDSALIGGPLIESPIADNALREGSERKRRRVNSSKEKPPGRRSNSGLLTGIAAVLAIVAGLLSFQLESDTGLATAAVISTFIAANIVLRVLAPLLTLFKMPVLIVSVLALAVVIGNLAEVEIAQNIFAFFKAIIDDLN